MVDEASSARENVAGNEVDLEPVYKILYDSGAYITHVVEQDMNYAERKESISQVSNPVKRARQGAELRRERKNKMAESIENLYERYQLDAKKHSREQLDEKRVESLSSALHIEPSLHPQASDLFSFLLPLLESREIDFDSTRPTKDQQDKIARLVDDSLYYIFSNVVAKKDASELKAYEELFSHIDAIAGDNSLFKTFATEFRRTQLAYHAYGERAPDLDTVFELRDSSPPLDEKKEADLHTTFESLYDWEFELTEDAPDRLKKAYRVFTDTTLQSNLRKEDPQKAQQMIRDAYEALVLEMIPEEHRTMYRLFILNPDSKEAKQYVQENKLSASELRDIIEDLKLQVGKNPLGYFRMKEINYAEECSLAEQYAETDNRGVVRVINRVLDAGSGNTGSQTINMIRLGYTLANIAMSATGMGQVAIDQQNLNLPPDILCDPLTPFTPEHQLLAPAVLPYMPHQSELHRSIGETLIPDDIVSEVEEWVQHQIQDPNHAFNQLDDNPPPQVSIARGRGGKLLNNEDLVDNDAGLTLADDAVTGADESAFAESDEILSDEPQLESQGESVAATILSSDQVTELSGNDITVLREDFVRRTSESSEVYRDARDRIELPVVEEGDTISGMIAEYVGDQYYSALASGELQVSVLRSTGEAIENFDPFGESIFPGDRIVIHDRLGKLASVSYSEETLERPNAYIMRGQDLVALDGGFLPILTEIDSDDIALGKLQYGALPSTLFPDLSPAQVEELITSGVLVYEANGEIRHISSAYEFPADTELFIDVQELSRTSEEIDPEIIERYLPFGAVAPTTEPAIDEVATAELATVPETVDATTASEERTDVTPPPEEAGVEEVTDSEDGRTVVSTYHFRGEPADRETIVLTSQDQIDRVETQIADVDARIEDINTQIASLNREIQELRSSTPDPTELINEETVFYRDANDLFVVGSYNPAEHGSFDNYFVENVQATEEQTYAPINYLYSIRDPRYYSDTHIYRFEDYQSYLDASGDLSRAEDITYNSGAYNEPGFIVIEDKTTQNSDVGEPELLFPTVENPVSTSHVEQIADLQSRVEMLESQDDHLESQKTALQSQLQQSQLSNESYRQVQGSLEDRINALDTAERASIMMIDLQTHKDGFGVGQNFDYFDIGGLSRLPLAMTLVALAEKSQIEMDTVIGPNSDNPLLSAVDVSSYQNGELTLEKLIEITLAGNINGGNDEFYFGIGKDITKDVIEALDSESAGYYESFDQLFAGGSGEFRNVFDFTSGSEFIRILSLLYKNEGKLSESATNKIVDLIHQGSISNGSDTSIQFDEVPGVQVSEIKTYFVQQNENIGTDRRIILIQTEQGKQYGLVISIQESDPEKIQSIVNQAVRETLLQTNPNIFDGVNLDLVRFSGEIRRDINLQKNTAMDFLYRNENPEVQTQISTLVPWIGSEEDMRELNFVRLEDVGYEDAKVVLTYKIINPDNKDDVVEIAFDQDGSLVKVNDSGVDQLTQPEIQLTTVEAPNGTERVIVAYPQADTYNADNPPKIMVLNHGSDIGSEFFNDYQDGRASLPQHLQSVLDTASERGYIVIIPEAHGTDALSNNYDQSILAEIVEDVYADIDYVADAFESEHGYSLATEVIIAGHSMGGHISMYVLEDFVENNGVLDIDGREFQLAAGVMIAPAFPYSDALNIVNSGYKPDLFYFHGDNDVDISSSWYNEHTGNFYDNWNSTFDIHPYIQPDQNHYSILSWMSENELDSWLPDNALVNSENGIFINVESPYHQRLVLDENLDTEFLTPEKLQTSDVKEVYAEAVRLLEYIETSTNGTRLERTFNTVDLETFHQNLFESIKGGQAEFSKFDIMKLIVTSDTPFETSDTIINGYRFFDIVHSNIYPSVDTISHYTGIAHENIRIVDLGHSDYAIGYLATDLTDHEIALTYANSGYHAAVVASDGTDHHFTTSFGLGANATPFAVYQTSVTSQEYRMYPEVSTVMSPTSPNEALEIRVSIRYPGSEPVAVYDPVGGEYTVSIQKDHNTGFLTTQMPGTDPNLAGILPVLNYDLTYEQYIQNDQVYGDLGIADLQTGDIEDGMFEDVLRVQFIREVAQISKAASAQGIGDYFEAVFDVHSERGPEFFLVEPHEGGQGQGPSYRLTEFVDDQMRAVWKDMNGNLLTIDYANISTNGISFVPLEIPETDLLERYQAYENEGYSFVVDQETGEYQTEDSRLLLFKGGLIYKDGPTGPVLVGAPYEVENPSGVNSATVQTQLDPQGTNAVTVSFDMLDPAKLATDDDRIEFFVSNTNENLSYLLRGETGQLYDSRTGKAFQIASYTDQRFVDPATGRPVFIAAPLDEIGNAIQTFSVFVDRAVTTNNVVAAAVDASGNFIPLNPDQLDDAIEAYMDAINQVVSSSVELVTFDEYGNPQVFTETPVMFDEYLAEQQLSPLKLETGSKRIILGNNIFELVDEWLEENLFIPEDWFATPLDLRSTEVQAVEFATGRNLFVKEVTLDSGRVVQKVYDVGPNGAELVGPLEKVGERGIIGYYDSTDKWHTFSQFDSWVDVGAIGMNIYQRFVNWQVNRLLRSVDPSDPLYPVLKRVQEDPLPGTDEVSDYIDARTLSREMIYAITLASEDKHAFERLDEEGYLTSGHSGIGTIRAVGTGIGYAFVKVLNRIPFVSIDLPDLKGGSTFAEQLSRNLPSGFGADIAEQNFSMPQLAVRKFILDKVNWADRLPLFDLMSEYLNSVQLVGPNLAAPGIQAASEYLFGVEVQNLSPQEVLLLAGGFQSPTRGIYSKAGADLYVSRGEDLARNWLVEGVVIDHTADIPDKPTERDWFDIYQNPQVSDFLKTMYDRILLSGSHESDIQFILDYFEDKGIPVTEDQLRAHAGAYNSLTFNERRFILPNDGEGIGLRDAEESRRIPREYHEDFAEWLLRQGVIDDEQYESLQSGYYNTEQFRTKQTVVTNQPSDSSLVPIEHRAFQPEISPGFQNVWTEKEVTYRGVDGNVHIYTGPTYEVWQRNSHTEGLTTAEIEALPEDQQASMYRLGGVRYRFVDGEWSTFLAYDEYREMSSTDPAFRNEYGHIVMNFYADGAITAVDFVTQKIANSDFPADATPLLSSLDADNSGGIYVFDSEEQYREAVREVRLDRYKISVADLASRDSGGIIIIDDFVDPDQDVALFDTIPDGLRINVNNPGVHPDFRQLYVDDPDIEILSMRNQNNLMEWLNSASDGRRFDLMEQYEPRSGLSSSQIEDAERLIERVAEVGYNIDLLTPQERSDIDFLLTKTPITSVAGNPYFVSQIDPDSPEAPRNVYEFTSSGLIESSYRLYVAENDEGVQVRVLAKPGEIDRNLYNFVSIDPDENVFIDPTGTNYYIADTTGDDIRLRFAGSRALIANGEAAIMKLPNFETKAVGTELDGGVVISSSYVASYINALNSVRAMPLQDDEISLIVDQINNLMAAPGGTGVTSISLPTVGSSELRHGVFHVGGVTHMNPEVFTNHAAGQGLDIPITALNIDPYVENGTAELVQTIINLETGASMMLWTNAGEHHTLQTEDGTFIDVPEGESAITIVPVKNSDNAWLEVDVNADGIRETVITILNPFHNPHDSNSEKFLQVTLESVLGMAHTGRIGYYKALVLGDTYIPSNLEDITIDLASHERQVMLYTEDHGMKDTTNPDNPILELMTINSELQTQARQILNSYTGGISGTATINITDENGNIIASFGTQNGEELPNPLEVAFNAGSTTKVMTALAAGEMIPGYDLNTQYEAGNMAIYDPDGDGRGISITQNWQDANGDFVPVGRTTDGFNFLKRSINTYIAGLVKQVEAQNGDIDFLHTFFDAVGLTKTVSANGVIIDPGNFTNKDHHIELARALTGEENPFYGAPNAIRGMHGDEDTRTNAAARLMTWIAIWNNQFTQLNLTASESPEVVYELNANAQKVARQIQTALFQSASEPGGTSYHIFEDLIRGHGVRVYGKTGTSDGLNANYVARIEADGKVFYIDVFIENGGQGSDRPARIARDMTELLLNDTQGIFDANRTMPDIDESQQLEMQTDGFFDVDDTTAFPEGHVSLEQPEMEKVQSQLPENLPTTISPLRLLNEDGTSGADLDLINPLIRSQILAINNATSIDDIRSLPYFRVLTFVLGQDVTLEEAQKYIRDITVYSDASYTSFTRLIQPRGGSQGTSPMLDFDRYGIALSPYYGLNANYFGNIVEDYNERNATALSGDELNDYFNPRGLDLFFEETIQGDGVLRPLIMNNAEEMSRLGLDTREEIWHAQTYEGTNTQPSMRPIVEIVSKFYQDKIVGVSNDPYTYYIMTETTGSGINNATEALNELNNQILTLANSLTFEDIHDPNDPNVIIWRTIMQDIGLEHNNPERLAQAILDGHLDDLNNVVRAKYGDGYSIFDLVGLKRDRTTIPPRIFSGFSGRQTN